jgi:hypothetical protein
MTAGVSVSRRVDIILSGLLARLSGRLIASQIRAMTTAMGHLDAGDTAIQIPPQGCKDE